MNEDRLIDFDVSEKKQKFEEDEEREKIEQR